MDALPEYGIPFLEDKYTGPYWSDGKIQSSVSNGTNQPKSQLEALSKRHDEAYHDATGISDRFDADWDYFQSTRDMGIVPQVVGAVPLLFNFVIPALTDFWSIPLQVLGEAVSNGLRDENTTAKQLRPPPVQRIDSAARLDGVDTTTFKLGSSLVAYRPNPTAGGSPVYHGTEIPSGITSTYVPSSTNSQSQVSYTPSHAYRALTRMFSGRPSFKRSKRRRRIYIA